MIKQRLAASLPRATLAAFILGIWGSSAAFASPIASVNYVETDLGGGQFRYDYTLSNLGDPLTDGGIDAFDLFLTFPSGSLLSSSTPPGWDKFSGDDFLDTFLPSEVGAGVVPGQSLGGFVLKFNSQVGSLPFDVYLGNPADPFNSFLYQGVTTPVPLPGTALLLGWGLVSLGLAKRRITVHHAVSLLRCTGAAASRRYLEA